MAVYPDLNISASQLVPSFLTEINKSTTLNNIPIFGVSLFLLLLVSIVVSAKRIYSFESAFAYGAFTHALLAGLAVKIGFFTSGYFYLSLLLLLVAVGMLALKGGNDG